MSNNNNFIPLKSKILELVNVFQTIETSQIFLYFKGIPEDNVKYAIKTLKSDGKLYQTESNKYTHINRAYDGVKPDSYLSRAFCVLTNQSFGYKNISFFDRLQFPKHLIFAAKNNLYEVSVIDRDNETTAKALLMRDKYKNREDSINICVVDSKELGKEMFEYGFDVYCLINEKNEAIFYQE